VKCYVEGNKVCEIREEASSYTKWAYHQGVGQTLR